MTEDILDMFFLTFGVFLCCILVWLVFISVSELFLARTPLDTKGSKLGRILCLLSPIIFALIIPLSIIFSPFIIIGLIYKYINKDKSEDDDWD